MRLPLIDPEMILIMIHVFVAVNVHENSVNDETDNGSDTGAKLAHVERSPVRVTPASKGVMLVVLFVNSCVTICTVLVRAAA